MEGSVGLRPLLLGPALNDREVDGTLAELSSHVAGLETLIKEIYGDSVASNDASNEMAVVAKFGNELNAVTCKRAALLFALYREPEVQRYFARQEAAVGSSYSKDMAERVLPFVVPRFLQNSCQAPDSFVQLCVILSEMWPGTRLGNWPLQQ